MIQNKSFYVLMDDSKPLYHNSSLSWALTQRQQVREIITPVGGFIKVCLSTPLTTCEARDVKGLYAKARRGKLKQFTGINDPYDIPDSPSLKIDTSEVSLTETLHSLIEALTSLGYLLPNERLVKSNSEYRIEQTQTRLVAQELDYVENSIG